MCNVEYFHKLSALAAIGQLSVDEDQELNNHLLDCSDCRTIQSDYTRVVQFHLPKADAIRWRFKSAPPTAGLGSEIRDRFIARARADGIQISHEAEQRHGRYSPRSRWTWDWKPAMALAGAAILAISAIAMVHHYRLMPRSSLEAANANSIQVAREDTALRQQLLTLQQTVSEESTQIGNLRQQTFSSDEMRQRYQKQLDDLTSQVRTLTSNLQEARSQNATLASADQELASTSQEKVAALADLRAQDSKLNREREDLLSSRTILEAQVHDLNEDLQEANANLERERQLMSVSKYVRQLMGARNLHIMDVHDVNGGGKAEKSFGRVFYAEGQSLIFYAFDLPIGGLSPAKYTFHAWGQRESGPLAVRNLGTFEVDDHEQRRWVLKVDNPALLAGIESVFVTAEALGDAKEPRGKKLMYAYIVGQPNHP